MAGCFRLFALEAPEQLPFQVIRYPGPVICDGYLVILLTLSMAESTVIQTVTGPVECLTEFPIRLVKTSFNSRKFKSTFSIRIDV